MHSSRTWKYSLLGGAVALALLAGGGVDAVQAKPEHQTVTTLAVQADGRDFTVSGANFRTNEPVFFWLNAPNGQVVPTWLRNDVISAESVMRAQADRDRKSLRDLAAEYDRADERGTVRARLSTEGLAPGFYGLVARGQTSTTTVVVGFEVRSTATPGPTPAPNQPALLTQPDGRNFTVATSAMRANEPVFYWLNAPNGQVVRLWNRGGALTAEAVVQEQATRERKAVRELAAEWDSADERGSDRLRLVVDGLGNGNYTLVARGHASGSTAITAFVVR
ncbi:MAG: hypothetical protein H7Z42_16225 [Roseiflexaceae bacterium]|nr:hypothetical protein [Roseiflexaceae bacterium]